MRKSLLSLIIPLVLISSPVRGDKCVDPEGCKDPNTIVTLCAEKLDCPPWVINYDKLGNPHEMILSRDYDRNGIPCCDFVYPIWE